MAKLVCFINPEQLMNNLFLGELPIGCFPVDSDFCRENDCWDNGLIIPTVRNTLVTFAKMAEESIDIDQLSLEDLDPFFLAGEGGKGWCDYHRPIISGDDRCWLEQNGIPF